MVNCDLARNNSYKIAYAVEDLIEEERKRNEHPFIPGYEDHTKHIEKLVSNIYSLYKKPRKYKELIYFLSILAEVHEKGE